MTSFDRSSSNQTLPEAPPPFGDARGEPERLRKTAVGDEVTAQSHIDVFEHLRERARTYRALAGHHGIVAQNDESWRGFAGKPPKSLEI